MTGLEEFRARREAQNARILGTGKKELTRFFALDSAAYRDGALPPKVKELMGLVASMVLRCNDCVFYHLDRAAQEGATRDEVIESMNIALVIGGSIVIPHLRTAFEVLDSLIPPDPVV